MPRCWAATSTSRPRKPIPTACAAASSIGITGERKPPYYRSRHESFTTHPHAAGDRAGPRNEPRLGAEARAYAADAADLAARPRAQPEHARAAGFSSGGADRAVALDAARHAAIVARGAEPALLRGDHPRRAGA